MSTNPLYQRYPFELRDQPPEVVQAHRYAFQGILDLNQAIVALKSQITSNTKAITTTAAAVSSTTSSTVITAPSTIGLVNNQTGNTTYSTAQSDYGAWIIFSSSSAIAVSLTTSPVISVPWYAIITNFGTGTITLTPSTGTITYPNNSAAASMPVTAGNVAGVVFDGTNFWAFTIFQAVNFSDNEVPSGTINGVNVTFTLAHTPNPSISAKGFVNGARQNPGAGNDFTISGATITFAVAPPTSSVILFDYRY